MTQRTQENLGQDRTNRKSRSTDLLTRRRSLDSALPLHTQKQCADRRSSWGSSIPVSDH